MAEKKTVVVDIKIQGNPELERLQANFDKSKRSLKSLNAAEKQGTITSRKANKARAELNVNLIKNRNALRDQQAALLKNNSALRKNSGFVAGVRKGMKQWATSMIGVTIAIAAVTKLVGSAVKIFVDFEKANSKLEAVLGATESQMKSLSDQAKELGATTAFTASEVTDLQTEFAKLGFPTNDILNMTEATLNGAAALGSGLGEQAALTGALLKQFGLDSSEAARVNDVMAKSAASSALDFSKLSTALPIVGATANAVGVNLEHTTALLGTLSDRGLDASTAGTSLRNVFLELSKKGLTMEEAMAKINGSTDKAKTSMELFGKRGATTGLILSETGEDVGVLEEKLNDANGAAKAMADTMLDNLAGDVTKANSAWEGFILSLEDGNNRIGKAMRGIVSSFTEMLNTFAEDDIADRLGLNRKLFQELSEFDQRIIDSAQNVSKYANNFSGTAKSLSDYKEEVDKLKATQAGLDRENEKGNATWLVYQDTIKAVLEKAKEFKDNPVKLKIETEIDGEDDAGGSTEGLTAAQKTAIESKAKATAKAQAEAMKAIEAREKEDLANEDVDEEAPKSPFILTDEELETIAAQKEQREQDAQDEFDLEQKKYEDIKAFEKLKQQARQESIGLLANGLSVIAGLAKEGSAEQKVLASGAALVQTYLAAQSAYASQMAILTPDAPIRAAVAAGIAVTAGLTNVAKINNVKFADGGVLEGNSHANGGIPFTVDGQSGFEAEGGEAIINKRSTAMFKPLLSQINEAGGGNRLFADGGLVPSTGGVSSLEQSLSSESGLEGLADQLISGIGSLEVINVATNTSDVANEVNNVQSESIF